MKICCCYHYTPDWPKFRWVHEALAELGHDVRWASNRKELMEHEPWADVTLFAHKSFPIRWPNLRDIWERRQSLWVQWWFDLVALNRGVPLADQPYIKQFRQHFDAMDLVFVKERELIGDYRELGIPAHYLDQGCPELFLEIGRRETVKWDVLVWGQGNRNYSQRIQDVNALVNEGLHVAWVGVGSDCPPGVEQLPWTHPERLHLIASQAKCVLHVGRRTDVGGYWSDSVWMALGMGNALLLRRPSGWPFDKDKICLAYCSTSELIKHANTLCKTHPVRGEAADRLGREARKWVMERHTIKHRCRALVAKVAAEHATARGLSG